MNKKKFIAIILCTAALFALFVYAVSTKTLGFSNPISTPGESDPVWVAASSAYLTTSTAASTYMVTTTGISGDLVVMAKDGINNCTTTYNRGLVSTSTCL